MGWGGAVRIDLTDAERSELRGHASARSLGRMRCGRRSCCWRRRHDHVATAERLGITRVTVAQAVCGEAPGRPGRCARPGAPLWIGEEKIAEVVTTTLETMPAAATHWSTRSMARGHGRLDLDRASHLASVLAAAAPQRDLEAVHRPSVHGEGPRHRRPLSRPAGALVLCVDEKSQIQVPDPAAAAGASRATDP